MRWSGTKSYGGNVETNKKKKRDKSAVLPIVPLHRPIPVGKIISVAIRLVRWVVQFRTVLDTLKVFDSVDAKSLTQNKCQKSDTSERRSKRFAPFNSYFVCATGAGSHNRMKRTLGGQNPNIPTKWLNFRFSTIFPRRIQI